MSAYKNRRYHLTTAGLVALLHVAVLQVLLKHGLTQDTVAPKMLVVYLDVPVAHPPAKPEATQPSHARTTATRTKPKSAPRTSKQAVETLASEAPQKSAKAAANPATEAAPKLDMDAMIEQAKGMDRRRIISGLDRLHESERQHGTLEEKFGTSVAKATREDCRTKYVSPTPNLLLLIPLAIETITDKGCKW
jgi:pyruvate/2-oxoglutarate dehydrogenase complex dihydrolipoamide acyltransferase (E2) component